MTVNRRAKPKNDSATETARVMRVFDMIVDELGRRYPAQPYMVLYDATAMRYEHNIIPDILAAADRIAARTEDPQ